jgi:hypothetical protein
MKNISTIKDKQIADLQSICTLNGIEYQSMEKLVQSERVKKLQKRNHYIQQTIDSEIEKALDNENK